MINGFEGDILPGVRGNLPEASRTVPLSEVAGEAGRKVSRTAEENP